MPDKISGHLEVGTDGHGQVIVNHSDIDPDKTGAGHIVFSVNQARGLAMTLLKKASEAESEIP